jgi:hypothetical protein
MCMQVRAKETINQLKDEISNLSKLVEKGAGLSMGQETMVKELVKVITATLTTTPCLCNNVY